MTTTFQLAGSGPENYERHLVPLFFKPWAGPLLAMVEPAPGERLLDVACGTGIVARTAAPMVGPTGAVTGLDLNPDMLAVARELQPSIAWYVADAADLPFPAGSFDIVTCQQGLQFCPDRAAVLAEIRRVLVPGGWLALNLWRPKEFSIGFAILIDVLERHAGPDAAAVMASPFGYGDHAEVSDLLHQTGFDDVRVRFGIRSVRFPSAKEFLHLEVASTPLAEPIAALPIEARQAMEHELAESLASYVDDDGLIFPMQTNLISGR